MAKDWDALFEDLDKDIEDIDPFYPGSKRKRKTPAAKVNKVEKQQAQDDWSGKPIKRMVNGKELDFYTVGALASALNKSEVSVRLWIRKGYIPTEPYRLPAITMPDGRVVPGKRLYLKEMIEAIRESFGRRGLLESRRIEWRDHPDLSNEILLSWSQIKAQLANKTPNKAEGKPL